MTNHGFYHTEAEFKEILKRPFVYEGGKMFGDPLEYHKKQKAQADEERLKKKEEGKTKKKPDENSESKSTDFVKDKNEDSDKNKKQNKKGEKNEDGQTKLRFSGDDSDPVE